MVINFVNQPYQDLQEDMNEMLLQPPPPSYTDLYLDPEAVFIVFVELQTHNQSQDQEPAIIMNDEQLPPYNQGQDQEPAIIAIAEQLPQFQECQHILWQIKSAFIRAFMPCFNFFKTDTKIKCFAMFIFICFLIFFIGFFAIPTIADGTRNKYLIN